MFHVTAHRPLQHARRQHGQDHFSPHRQLAAEAPADVAAHDAHLLLRDLQRVGDALLRTLQQLRRAMHDHAVALPPGDRRVRLHLRVDVHRRRVLDVHLHVRTREAGVEVALAAVRLLAFVLAGSLCLVEMVLQQVLARHRLVLHVHQQARRARLFERLGDDEGRRHAVVRHDGVAETGMRTVEALALGEAEARLLRRVEVRHHHDDARSALGFSGVDGNDAPATYGRLDDVAVERRLRRFLHFVGIRRGAAHLLRSVDTIEVQADQALAVHVQRVARSRLVHLHARPLRPKLPAARRRARGAAAES